jgi:hypothetical protein
MRRKTVGVGLGGMAIVAAIGAMVFAKERPRQPELKFLHGAELVVDEQLQVTTGTGKLLSHTRVYNIHSKTCDLLAKIDAEMTQAGWRNSFSITPTSVYAVYSRPPGRSGTAPGTCNVSLTSGKAERVAVKGKKSALFGGVKSVDGWTVVHVNEYSAYTFLTAIADGLTGAKPKAWSDVGVLVIPGGDLVAQSSARLGIPSGGRHP